MRKWGIVITCVYVLVFVVFVAPSFLLLIGAELFSPAGISEYTRFLFRPGITWIFGAVFVACEAVMIVVSVDTSQKRLKPRAHVALTCAVTATLVTLLTAAALFSIILAMGTKASDDLFKSPLAILVFVFGLWMGWSVVFYIYFRELNSPITRAITWLLRGSVLELLIAVPCHIIVRRRGDCSAPIVTGFGISTGIAIMLLSFGPSVLFLYKKRLDGYSSRAAAKHT